MKTKRWISEIEDRAVKAAGVTFANAVNNSVASGRRGSTNGTESTLTDTSSDRGPPVGMAVKEQGAEVQPSISAADNTTSVADTRHETLHVLVVEDSMYNLTLCDRHVGLGSSC